MRSYREILRLVWPLALGMVNNAVMQFVDRAYLARESMASLEAALPASILAFNILGFFSSIIAYSGTFVAQYHGAGDSRMCRMSLRAGNLLAVAFGLAAFAFVPAGSAILKCFATGPEVLSREVAYYSIVTSGGIFIFLQMAVASYFTGLGRTRLVFWVNVFGNVFNAAVDPLLIFGLCGCPRLGMAGAAYATVASTALQWAVLAVMSGRIRERGGLLPLFERILRFGVPAGAYTVLNMLSFTIFVFVTERVGDVAFAVSNACFAVNYLIFAPMEGFALGAATLVGQAQGRGDAAAAHRNAMRTLLLGVVFVAAVSLLAVAFCRPILSIFSPDDAEVSAEFVSLGSTLFLWMAAWQVFDATDIIISGALKGAGDTKFVFWWMFIVAFCVWLPIVGVVAHFGGSMSDLWGTMVVYVVIICIGSSIRWRRGHWRTIRLVPAQAKEAVNA